jgi:hypothetical protein
MIGVALSGCALAHSVSASWPLRLDLEGGMEYLAWKWKVQDRDSKYLHSVWQSALALAGAGLNWGPARLGARVGLADTEIAGEWQGTGLERYAPDPFFWGRNQALHAYLTYCFFSNWEAYLEYHEHQFEHRDRPAHQRLAGIRWQQVRVGAGWQFIRRSDLVCRAVAFALPGSWAWYEQRALPSALPNPLAPGENTSRGWGAGGMLQLEYQHALGWGANLGIEYLYARQDGNGNLTRIDIRSGRMTGELSYTF